MALKVGGTTVANDSAQVDWATISGITANSYVNAVSTSYLTGSGNNFPVNITLLNGTLTITYIGRAL